MNLFGRHVAIVLLNGGWAALRRHARLFVVDENGFQAGFGLPQFGPGQRLDLLVVGRRRQLHNSDGLSGQSGRVIGTLWIGDQQVFQLGVVSRLGTAANFGHYLVSSAITSVTVM